MFLSSPILYPLAPLRKETETNRTAMLRGVSTFFYQRKVLALLLLLAPVLLWLGVVYLGSLFALLIQSFFRLDDFTGQVVREFSLSSYQKLSTPANLAVIGRTVTMAASVTLVSIIVAFPLAYSIAKTSSPALRSILYLLVLMPLWSSYIVRVYAWKLILAKEGVFNWVVQQLHLGWLLESFLKLPVVGGPSLSISATGTFLVFLYIWLPYMVLPIAASLERIPKSLLEASSDLGGKPNLTFWRVIMPLTVPGIAAGSIFTFSLTLGDYIIPGIVGNSKPFIGQVVLVQQGTAGNIPLAAAFTVVPIVIMAVYLLIARRLGAFDAL
jgi:putative spermidine/putrescine transport system permease protein